MKTIARPNAHPMQWSGILAICVMLIALTTNAALAKPQEMDDLTLSPTDMRANGEEIAATMCAMCHAIGLRDTSAHESAPPFREVFRQYPVYALEEALAEGIVVGHRDMPAFELEPQQIDELLSYIEYMITDPAPE